MTPENISIIVVTALVTSGLSFLVQHFISENQRLLQVKHDRLTKLLLPLYIRLNEEFMDWQALCGDLENNDPAEFIDDLPRYYEPIVPILENNLHLADDDLTQVALNFIAWVKVAGSSNSRYSNIVAGGVEDKEVLDLRKCVEAQYKKEKNNLMKRNWLGIYF